MNFLYSTWIKLPIETRIKIAGIFNIPKQGPTHVFNNEIQSDGYSIKEIESALTIPALQGYLGSQETDMLKLWTMLVDKVEGRVTEVKVPEVNPPESITPTTFSEPDPYKIPEIKKEIKKRKAKKK